MTDKSAAELKQEVLAMAKEHDVKFVHLWFTDILGILKSFSITVEELELGLEEGMGFDGSSIEGFARIDESDMIAMPDPSPFVVLPWRPRDRKRGARIFCAILHPHAPPASPPSPGRSGPSVGGPPTTGWPPASTRSTCATRTP